MPAYAKTTAKIAKRKTYLLRIFSPLKNVIISFATSLGQSRVAKRLSKVVWQKEKLVNIGLSGQQMLTDEGVVRSKSGGVGYEGTIEPLWQRLRRRLTISTLSKPSHNRYPE